MEIRNNLSCHGPRHERSWIEYPIWVPCLADIEIQNPEYQKCTKMLDAYTIYTIMFAKERGEIRIIE